MKPTLIDTHCHVHFPAYNEDREAVLLRMRKENIWGITVGTNAATSKGAVEFSEVHPDIFATVGYHPEHLTSSYHDENEGYDPEPYSPERIRDLAASSARVVAIGETGLDFYRIDEDRERASAIQLQLSAFRDHIRLAKELHLPLVIHCRNAFREVADVIQDERGRGNVIEGVVHCFTGNWTEAQPLLDLGLHLSFTGIISFPPKKTDVPASSMLRVIERMPLERLLVETDAPWLTPVPYRGKRNEPSYVSFVANAVAQLRCTTAAEIAYATTENAFRLFRLQES